MILGSDIVKKRKRKNNIKYSKIVIFFSLFLFCLIIFRVVQLGLSSEIDGINLKKLASSRTTRTDVISANRGTIYSSNGDVLAQNVASYKLIAYLDPKRTTNENNPQHVVDKELTATQLGALFNVDKSVFLEFLNKENVYQTEFGIYGKDLNEIQKKQIEDLNLPGIGFIESFKRYYPKGNFASYTIGYTKNSNDTGSIYGEMGIEKQYNDLLKGEDGYITYQKDLKGYKIADTPVIQKDAVQGKNIYLTIDSSIQFFVEQALNNQDRDYDWEWFHITLLDAKTGAVLATSTSPSFDPNVRDIKNYLDMMVASPYEPGSTMKTFTYMAAMENGVYDGNETYKSGVYVTQDGTEIGDCDRNGWGVISYDKGYALSSNVGVINLINRHMSSVMLRQYFKKLGFGRKTGISLPNELKGNLEFRYETEIYNAGFGQGITTTPIQNVKALTPLTNDGMLLEPYIISKIVNQETGEVILENNRDEIDRVASSNTVNKMIQLMDDCVNGIGNTGSGYRISNGELIGKTGTAQIANESGGGYLSGKEDIISSFSGIYPKSNPQIIIYASVKKPSGGSQKPISNAVKEIVNNISKYYGNDDNSHNMIKINKYNVGNYINSKLNDVKTILDTNGISYQVFGNGDKIVKQYPDCCCSITNDNKIYLFTNDNVIVMPDVSSLSSKVSKGILEKMGLKVTLDGVGYVTSQSIPAGTVVNLNDEVVLTLSPKY